MWASVDDSGNDHVWNMNYEANALTDRGVFRIFRDGAISSNTYRVEPNEFWFLRSIYNNNCFLSVNNYGNLGIDGASGARQVRPSVTIYFL